MKNNITKHHKFESQDGWNLHYDNILLIDEVKHRCLHILFWQENVLPLEKIDTIFEMHKSTLKKEVTEDIKNLLDFWKSEWREAYNPKVLKPNNIFNK